MKKLMMFTLSSLAVSVLLLGYAGSAAATPFGGYDDDSDSDRKSKGRSKVVLSDDDSDRDQKSNSRLSFLKGGYDDDDDSDRKSKNRDKGFLRDDDSDSDRKSKSHPKFSRGGHDDESDSDGRPGTYPKPGNDDPVAAIPEPSAAMIFAAGLAVAGLRRRRS